MTDSIPQCFVVLYAHSAHGITPKLSKRSRKDENLYTLRWIGDLLSDVFLHKKRIEKKRVLFIVADVCVDHVFQLSSAIGYRIYSIVHPSLFCLFFFFHIYFRVLRSLLFFRMLHLSLFFLLWSYPLSWQFLSDICLIFFFFFCLMPVAYNLIVHSSFSDDHLVPANYIGLDGHLPLSFHSAFSGDIPN